MSTVTLTESPHFPVVSISAIFKVIIDSGAGTRMDYYTTWTYSLEVKCSSQPRLTEAVHSLMGSYLWRLLVEVNNGVVVFCYQQDSKDRSHLPFIPTYPSYYVG